MNIKLFFIIFSFFIYHFPAQELDNLKQDYIKYRVETNSNLIKLTAEKKSWKWLSLLPTVSLSSSWDPFTQAYKPMVNFGISLSNLSSYIQNANRNRIEREKLNISLQEQLVSENNAIDAEILDLQKDSIALIYEQQNIKLLEELNTIKSKQYEQNQINLEEKIRHQIILNNNKNAFEIKKLNYKNKKKKLINKLTKNT